MVNFHSPPRPRRGYTLVELLVVIAIIGVLAGLILSAVQRVKVKGEEAALRADLQQFEQAIGQFKSKYNRNPPWFGGGPQATFRLCSEYPDVTPVNAWPERDILKRMFGRMSDSFNGLLLDPLTAPKFVKWAPTSTAAGAPATFNGLPVTVVDGPVLLDPNQCLVFFLSGGKHVEYLGFSTNPTTPFLPATAPGQQRAPGMPFFEFQKKNLVTPVDWLERHTGALNALPSAPTPALTGGAGVYRWEGTGPAADNVGTISNESWYVDPWGTPYLYMAASGTGSGGDYVTSPIAHPTGGRVQIAPWGGKLSGYNRQTTRQYPNAAAYATFPNMGPTPFKDTANKFVNHGSFQIISGGPNGSETRNDYAWGFGLAPAGVAKFGEDDFDAGKGAGGDDFANFRKTFLGAPD
jgi:prepilin-type N-terminal cleavage/methylation domain-containing protein